MTRPSGQDGVSCAFIGDLLRCQRVLGCRLLVLRFCCRPANSQACARVDDHYKDIAADDDQARQETRGSSVSSLVALA